MRQTIAFAATIAITAVVSSIGTSVIIAQSASKPNIAAVARDAGQVVALADLRAKQATGAGNTDTTATDESWTRWPSVVDF